MENQRDFVIDVLEKMIERLKNGACLEKKEVKKLVTISGKMKQGRFEDEKSSILIRSSMPRREREKKEESILVKSSRVKMTPVFASEEQERLFAKAAQKAMEESAKNGYPGLSWEEK